MSEKTLTVSENALRELVRETLEPTRGPVNASKPRGPVNVDPVVAKDAALSDPVNPTFVPQDKEELQVMLPTMVKGIEKADVPEVYRAFKDVIDKTLESGDEMKQQNKSKTSVESVIRRHVKSIIREMIKHAVTEAAPALPPVRGTENFLVGEPVPEPHDYNTLYNRIYAAASEWEDDKLYQVLFQDCESEEIISDAADALMAMTAGDPDVQEIAREIEHAQPSQLKMLVTDFLDTVDQKKIVLIPDPPVRMGKDDTLYTKSPEDLEQLKHREKLEKEKIDAMHGTMAAEMGTSASTVINIERSGKDKLVLKFMWDYDINHGAEESFSELARMNMQSNTNPELSLAWTAKIIACALSMDKPPEWLEKDESSLWKRCQKGYEIFAAAVEDYVDEFKEFKLSNEQAIQIAIETDPFSGSSTNKKEHKFFIECFDEISRDCQKKGLLKKEENSGIDLARFVGYRTFLMYWGQDMDKLFDKVMHIYNVAAIDKNRELRRQEDIAMGRTPRGAPARKA